MKKKKEDCIVVKEKEEKEEDFGDPTYCTSYFIAIARLYYLLRHVSCCSEISASLRFYCVMHLW